ncbi:hypothetical protein GS452_28135 [Rhodococcus hoagii]|nr:hypothetical protein [Prescottella equi]
MTVVTYTGMGSKVTLDSEAQTLTFEHSGMLNSKHRKKASPWVVPLGAIETIEWRETKIKAAEFRPLLHGRAGFDEKKDQDLSYVSGTEKIGEFVEAVEAARQATRHRYSTSLAGELNRPSLSLHPRRASLRRSPSKPSGPSSRD